MTPKPYGRRLLFSNTYLLIPDPSFTELTAKHDQ
jgi:hypothetical protein